MLSAMAATKNNKIRRWAFRRAKGRLAAGINKKPDQKAGLSSIKLRAGCPSTT
jgi:hypothetical protein